MMDRRTDGQTHDNSIYCTSTVSRAKNCENDLMYVEVTARQRSFGTPRMHGWLGYNGAFNTR